MIVTIVIYFILFAFWIENSIGFMLEQYFGMRMGLSWQNLSLYGVIMIWFYRITITRKLFQLNELSRFLIALVFIALASILIKFIILEKHELNLLSEIVSLKNWIEPWIFFFLIYNIIDDKETCKKAILGLNILMIVTILATVSDIFGYTDFGTAGDLTWEGRYAGFAESNQYAAFLVLLLPLSMSSIFFQRNALNFGISSIIVLLSLATLVATSSRGGILALFFGVMVLGIFLFKKKMINRNQIGIGIMAAILLGFFSFIVLPQDVKDKFYERIDPDKSEYSIYATESSWHDRYSSGRTTLWLNILEIYIDSPIFGYGNDADHNQFKMSTHNDFLKYLFNYGIIGLLVYLMMYISIFRFIKNMFERTSDAYSTRVYLSYLSGFSGYLMAMMFVNMFIPRLIFWVYTAIVYKYALLENDQNLLEKAE
jgi:O-antigen ligase